jgi:ABC-2 type transport system permease protein
VSALAAQSRAEISMTLRRGESLLLTVGIPVLLLVFFSSVAVVAVPAVHRVNFITPGILSLCVLSTSLVSLGIATGFERGYGVLKRLFVTPLGRGRLLTAKGVGVLCVEAVQVVVVGAVAAALGWHPRVTGASVAAAIACAILASVAFSGIGLAMAGRLRPEVNLAAANGLYLVLLLSGGMIVPLATLPGGIGSIARALPTGALTTALHDTLALGRVPDAATWAVLAAWAIAAPAAAAATFRFDPDR